MNQLRCHRCGYIDADDEFRRWWHVLFEGGDTGHKLVLCAKCGDAFRSWVWNYGKGVNSPETKIGGAA